MEKNKVFSNSVINFILLQMLGITFVCSMLFVDIFIDQEFTWLKLGMLSFTFLVFIVYEIVITYFFRKNQKVQEVETEAIEQEEEKKHHSHNEKYLWFLLMVLLDIILLVSVITNYVTINTYILLFVTFAVFYAIAVFIRPYFGVVHHGE